MTTTGTTTTMVHLLRHGEVHNPEGILYGRRDGFHLSALGNRMAERIAASIGDRDIVHLRVSPLERAQETARPLAAARGLEIVTDERVIESANKLEGPVRDFDDASRTDSRAYAAFFHAMLDHGVYLPPSAYEAWFLSSAHDDRAVQTVLDALPVAARAAARTQES